MSIGELTLMILNTCVASNVEKCIRHLLTNNEHGSSQRWICTEKVGNMAIRIT
ncbi:MAG: hypothetical protein KatS3mg109_0568 [Pirellulaceae bacterium]|nr:MAG: hypothetical protein KatS3mg109_0568 [Pirellulaceae bacterium]